MLVFPVYEADVTALMSRPEDHTLTFWLSFGRPLAFFVMMPLMMLAKWIGLPAAAQVIGLTYVIVFAFWLIVLAKLLSLLMHSRRAGVITACFIALHFHFYECRMWSALNVLVPSIAVTGVFLLAHNGQMDRWKTALLAVIVMLLSLNYHQSGAFFLAAPIGLGVIAAIFSGDSFHLGDIVRRYLPLCVGAGVALIIYGMEVLIIKQTIGLVDRSETGSLVHNFTGFVKKMALWGPAIVPLPQAVRSFPLAFVIITGVILGFVWKCLRDLDIPRKSAAVLLAVISAVVSCLPTMLTQGEYSSRVLLSALVVLWGSVAFALHRGMPRSSQMWRGAVYGVLFVAWICHMWGFALVVMIRHLPVAFTKQVRQELVNAGVKSGDEILFYGKMPVSRSVAWSDSGLQIYAAPWGGQSMMSSIMNGVEIPQPVTVAYKLPDIGFDPDAPLVTRSSDGQLQINGTILGRQQIELEQRFIHPFRLDQ